MWMNVNVPKAICALTDLPITYAHCMLYEMQLRTETNIHYFCVDSVNVSSARGNPRIPAEDTIEQTPVRNIWTFFCKNLSEHSQTLPGLAYVFQML